MSVGVRGKGSKPPAFSYSSENDNSASDSEDNENRNNAINSGSASDASSASTAKSRTKSSKYRRHHKKNHLIFFMVVQKFKQILHILDNFAFRCGVAATLLEAP